MPERPSEGAPWQVALTGTTILLHVSNPSNGSIEVESQQRDQVYLSNPRMKHTSQLNLVSLDDGTVSRSGPSTSIGPSETPRVS